MERREGFFEGRRRRKAEERALQEAALNALRQAGQEIIRRDIAVVRRRYTEEAAILNERATTGLRRGSIESTMRYAGEARRMVAKFADSPPIFREAAVNTVTSATFNIWRGIETTSRQSILDAAGDLISEEQQLAGFDLLGVKLSLPGVEKFPEESLKYLTEEDLRTMYLRNGATPEQADKLFGVKPKDK